MTISILVASIKIIRLDLEQLSHAKKIFCILHVCIWEYLDSSASTTSLAKLHMLITLAGNM